MTMGDDVETFRRQQAVRFPQHSCELQCTPDRVFPSLPPNATIWHRLRHFIQRQIIAWRKSKPLRLMRPSNMQLEYEQAHHIRSNHWWVIHPMSRFSMVWQAIMIVLISESLAFWPVGRAFGSWKLAMGTDGPSVYGPDWDNVDNDTIHEYKKSVHIIDQVFSYFVRAEGIVYWIHILVKFNTGYVNRQTNSVEMRPFEIIKRYLKTTFFLDILSCGMYYREGQSKVFYGTENLQVMVQPAGTVYRGFLILLGGFQIFQAVELFRCLKNWFEFLNLRKSLKLILFCVVFYIICVHWLACLSVLIPIHIHGKSIFRKDSYSWLNNKNYFMLYPNITIGRKYLTALSRMVRFSRGDLIPSTERGVTTEDYIIIILIIWIGYIFYLLLLALILHFLASHLRAEVKMARVTQEVQNFMRQGQLPVNLRHKILLYYGHTLHGRYMRPRALLANMPTKMRDAIREACCSRLVGQTALFQSMPKALVLSVVRCLREELYLPNDVVYNHGSRAKGLYFLSTGAVAVLAPTGEEIGHLDDGAYFGELELVAHRQPRLLSVVAIEVSQVYMLLQADFLRLLKPYPRFYSRLRATSMKKAKELLEWDDVQRRASFTDSSDDDDDLSTTIDNMFSPTKEAHENPEAEKDRINKKRKKKPRDVQGIFSHLRKRRKK